MEHSVHRIKRLTKQRILKSWMDTARQRGTSGLVRDHKMFEERLTKKSFVGTAEARRQVRRERNRSKMRLQVYREHRDEILAPIPAAP